MDLFFVIFASEFFRDLIMNGPPPDLPGFSKGILRGEAS